MPTGLIETRRRIVAARQIAKATSALRKVAAVHLMRARRALEATDRYHAMLTGLARELRRADTGLEHPFLRPGGSGTIRVLVIGSDRGLCGAFNTQIVEELTAFARRRRPSEVRCDVIGRVTARRLRRAGYAVDRVLPQPPVAALSQAPDGGAVAALYALATEPFLAGQAAEVCLLHTEFAGAYRYAPAIRRILPLTVAADGEAGAPRAAAPWMRRAGFEPGPAAILADLLPEYVRTSLRHALAGSLASENAARQAAMARATDNAREMLGELTRRFSRLRQENITAELLEIAGGTGKR
ncbi:MAG: F0F1 ATP synthase subunit gamma [Lentisphaerae bacterium]|nr:F0F1 ATP synthase subunit gamma [Lentisphaerota bacterium]